MLIPLNKGRLFQQKEWGPAQKPGSKKEGCSSISSSALDTGLLLWGEDNS